MRANAMQPVRERAPVVRPKRSPVAAMGIAAVVLLAAVGGYFVWGRRPAAGDPASVHPLSAGALHDALTEAQVDAGELEALLASDPGIEKFAEAAAGSASSAFDKADGVMRALRARASALAFVPWSLGEPRTTPVVGAKQTLATLSKDKGRAQLYPLEVAALATAALRAVDVPAQVAELIAVDGERAPLDPSGYLGYFVVAVYPAEAGLGTPRLFDVYGGRALAPGAKHNVLSDPSTIGVALSLRALHEVSYLADPKSALTSSSHAILLAGKLPSVRTVRGMVVLAGRQVEQGLQEFAAASQLRSDAPRLHNLASAALMTGDVERATKELSSALERAPDFAAAHATLGSLALVRGELDVARAELGKAEQLAPDLSLVQWALAELQLRGGDRDQALTTARRAVQARPSFDAKLRMGVLLRQAARYDELRELAAELLKMAPAYRQAEVREMIGTVLGPAALDADARDPEAETEPSRAPNLGGDEPQLDPALEPLGATTLPQPGSEREPKLRLRGSGDNLQLKLGR
jgi:tetratricopeptide (TPR) repeat protein